MNDRVPAAPSSQAGWILFCAFCSWVGWSLSLLHQLNVAGYAVASALGGVALAVWWQRAGVASRGWPHWPKLRRRFRRLGPAVFLVFAVLTFVAGAIYPPNYYDALAYRLPRVLHWLAEGQWHWIHTGFNRVNTRGCGFEWVAAPVLALTRSDRLLFLTSFVPFCLLPGLIFRSFTRLGVAKRTAYAWMWVLPLGCCFVLQSGTLGNDLLSAAFALAAVNYGLRARQTGRIQQVWLALLAAALATGVKANTLPLVLVWAVVLAPCWRLIWSRWAPTLGVCFLALGCSFFPTALLNAQKSGDWTGARAEGLPFVSSKPWVRLVGNGAMLVFYNLNPPLAPFAPYWNAQVAPRLVSAKLTQEFRESFGYDGVLFTWEEVATDHSGLGLGLCALLGLSSLAALRIVRKRPAPEAGPVIWRGLLFFGALAVAVLVLLETSFVKSTVRLMSPYYLLMVVPLLLLRGHTRVVRGRAWKLGVLAVAVLAALPLVVRPDRPLVPVHALLSTVQHLGWSPRLVARVERVYSTYGQRAEALVPALQGLPTEGTSVLGLISYDDPESTLWKPYGERRLLDICPGDTSAQLRARGVRCALVSGRTFHLIFGATTFEEWLRGMPAEVVQSIRLTERAAEGEETWYLVRLL